MNTIVDGLIEAKQELQCEHAAKMEQLDGLIEQASKLFGRGLQSKPMTRKPKIEKLQRVPIGAKIARAVRGGSGLAACVPMIRGLKEPFTAADVGRVCKVDKKKASNILNRMKAKEWLQTAGWGRVSTHGDFRRDPTQRHPRGNRQG